MMTTKNGLIAVDIPPEGLTIIDNDGRRTQILRHTKSAVVTEIIVEPQAVQQPLPLPANEKELARLREEVELLKAENNELMRRVDKSASAVAAELDPVWEKCQAVFEASGPALEALLQYKESFPDAGAMAGFTERDTIGGVHGKLKTAIDSLRYSR